MRIGERVVDGTKSCDLREDHAVHLTDWDLVGAASRPNPSHLALDKLLERYIPVMRTYIVSQFLVPPEQADDWLQDFLMAKMVHVSLVSNADSSRGTFRTYLLKALRNYVIQQLRRERASKRSPKTPQIPIHQLPERELDKLQEASVSSFDLDWARRVLQETLQRMEEQCRRSKRSDIWGVFERRLLRPLLDDSEPEPYEELVARFGIESPAQASNLLITAKRMFARVLREILAKNCRDEAEVESEVAALAGVLFQSKAGLGFNSRK
jgi:RNA polymerase sigma factor (sigma-70 family)